MFSKFLKLKLKPYSSVFTKSEFVSEWNILFIQTEIIRFVHDRQKGEISFWWWQRRVRRNCDKNECLLEYKCVSIEKQTDFERYMNVMYL